MADHLSRTSTNNLFHMYAQILRSQGHTPKRSAQEILCDHVLDHALWMCEEAITFSQEDKKQRWLGFVQAILWIHRSATLNELKSHVIAAYDFDVQKATEKLTSGMCMIKGCKRQAQVINGHVTSICKKHAPRPA